MSFYGVHAGRSTGVFESWSIVEPLVKGFPGAKFKKFQTKAEATEFAVNGTTEAKVTPDVISVQGIHIFTDGAYSAKTKRSGFGVWFTPPQFEALSVSQSLTDGTTNQEAELTAIITALTIVSQKLPRDLPVTVWTDSDYSMKCLTVYIKKWNKHGWTTSSGSEVKHKELIQRGANLLAALQDRVTLRHLMEIGLESHQSAPPSAGTLTRFVWEGNMMADKLATKARE
jgi:ribonuclease HI